jgi:hypothetical protein
MAPKKTSNNNNNIVTLDDITSHRRSDGNNNNNESSSSAAALVSRNSTNQNDPSSFFTNNFNGGYCQPVGQGNNKNPPGGPIADPKLFIIPNLPLNDVCEQTIQRIYKEFIPIIRRRQYNVLSISEMCCCSDGLDYEPDRKRRKCRIMGNNVLGYNNTAKYFSSGGIKKQQHRIHLRLRNPFDHNQLYEWEDVAGTMAHELSHCVHQNHNSEFYKLMEDILEEHAQAQANSISGGGSQPSFLRPTNARTVQRDVTQGPRSTVTAGPTIGGGTGHRLGGNATKGQSRLLDQFSNGQKLGGNTTDGRGVLGPNELRQRMLRAAEARQRQLQLVRKMVEKAKEPCVIEILDSDDEDDDGQGCNNNGKNKKDLDSKPAAAAKRPKKSQLEIINLSDDDEDDDIDKKPVAKNHNKTSKGSNKIELSSVVIDLTVEDSTTSVGTASPSSVMGVTIQCNRCTFKNPATAHKCEICLGEFL